MLDEMQTIYPTTFDTDNPILLCVINYKVGYVICVCKVLLLFTC